MAWKWMDSQNYWNSFLVAFENQKGNEFCEWYIVKHALPLQIIVQSYLKLKKIESPTYMWIFIKSAPFNFYLI